MNTRVRQQGFLSIVTIALVLIVALIAVTAAYQFTTDTVSSYNTLKAAQAYAAAQTGVSNSTTDIVKLGNSCAGYNSGIVNYTLPNGISGQYQTTGTTSAAISTLPGGRGTGSFCDDDTGDDNRYHGGNYAGYWNYDGNWNNGGHHGNKGKNDTNYQNSCRNSGWHYGWGGHGWKGNHFRWGGGSNDDDHGNGWGDQGHSGWGNSSGGNTGGITSTATSITLSDSTGFTVPGAIMIDNELIYYTGISGNTLTGVIRGVNGTAPAAHNAGAIVIQNQCFLNTVSGIPTLDNSAVQRVFRILLAGESFGYIQDGAYTVPTTSSSGSSFNFTGDAVIYNPNVLLNGTGFSGANIITSGSMNWNTSGSNDPTTKVGNNVTASTGSGSNQKADVKTSSTLFNSGNFFSQYFTQSFSTVRSNAIANNTFYTNSSSLINLTNNVIWFDGNLTLSSGYIGSSSAPVLLIVNGNLTMSNSAAITGFVYVVGTTTLSNNARITGSLASAGNISLTDNATVKLSLSVLTKTNQMSGNMNTQYNPSPVTMQESFQ